MKRLVVIVLNWNGLADTRACLRSLAACAAPRDWSVAVMMVDNGSSDGSVAAVREEFPNVDVVALPENLRFAGGNNAGVKRALAQGADAVMLLNNDTEADPALFVHLVAALDADPGAGAVAPLIDFAQPRDLIWYAGAACTPALGLAAHRGLRQRDTGQYTRIESTGYLTGCALLARRDAWEKVGLLDERYYIYAEDTDWSLRARAAGYRLLFVPAAKLWHKVSASTGNASAWKMYQRTRANWTLFARHARGIGRLTWLVCFGAQMKAMAVVLLLRGQWKAAGAVYRALWDAMWGKPAGAVKL